jgi:LmbE family N-acetylglucosaminyl deacetylase
MSDTEKRTILAIGAHPSDLVANMGGALGKHAQHGDRVILLTLTYGLEVHTERFIGKPEAEIKRLVRKESEDAAGILGLHEFMFLDFGDTPLVMTRQNLQELADVMQDIRPDLILCAHYPFRELNSYNDHSEAARMVERAPTYRHHGGKKAYQPPAIWFAMVEAMQFARPTPHVPDVYVDITDTMDLKIKACIATWDMQGDDAEHTAKAIRAMDSFYGQFAGVPYAEGFETFRRPRAVGVLGL